MSDSHRCCSKCSCKKQKGVSSSGNVTDKQNTILFNFYPVETAKSNHISTCKYTWYNFLLKFFFEQYQRPNNIFFLSVLVCNSIPGLGIVGFGTILTPIVFILVISAIREIIEDIGRSRADKLANSKVYKLVRKGELLSVPASKICQGDLLIIEDGDEVPADCLLMLSSSKTKVAMVNTASLDGESNLKPRNSILTQFESYSTETELITFLKTLWGRMTVYPPNSNLTLFTGKVSYHWSPQIVNQMNATAQSRNVDPFQSRLAIKSMAMYNGLPSQVGGSPVGAENANHMRNIASPSSAVFASGYHPSYQTSVPSPQGQSLRSTSVDAERIRPALPAVDDINEIDEDSILNDNPVVLEPDDSVQQASSPIIAIAADFMDHASEEIRPTRAHLMDFDVNKTNSIFPVAIASQKADDRAKTLPVNDNDERMFSGDATLNLSHRHFAPTTLSHKSSDTHKLLHFNTDNTLLRGMKLQNTDFAVGAVIYTAYDTRLMMNQTKPALKLSHVQKRLDRVLMLEILLLVLGTIITGSVAAIKTAGFAEAHPYAGIPKGNGGYIFVTRGMSYAVLFAYALPVSLFVSLELARLVQGILIEMDKRLRKEELLPCLAKDATDPLPPAKVHCVVKSSALIEDLAEVDIIFSDKTGTLTSNEMVFHSFYTLFDGVQCVYDTVVKAGNPTLPCEINYSTIVLETKEKKSEVSDLIKFALGLCNTIIATEKGGCLIYQGESPDEIAFVKAAAAFKLVITGREADCVKYSYTFTIDEQSINPQLVTVPVTYTFPVTVPFTSSRKRMSIVLCEQGIEPPEVLIPMINPYLTSGSPCPSPNPTDLVCFTSFSYSRSKRRVFFTPILLCSAPGNPFLLSKGADTFLLPLCKPIMGENPLSLAPIKAAIDNFSCEGLRTLAWAVRELSPTFLEGFLRTWHEVSIRQESDPEYIQHVAELEKDMTFLAASAIEDRLADMVPETLATLVSAGIKVWMLTGDKTQTAINIARSSNLVPLESEWLYLTYDEVLLMEEKLKKGEMAIPQIPEFVSEKLNRSPTKNKLLALLTLLDVFEKRVSPTVIKGKRRMHQTASFENMEASVRDLSESQLDKKGGSVQSPPLETSAARRGIAKFGKQLKEAFSFTDLYRKKKEYRTTVPFTTVIDSDVFKLIYMNNLHDFLLSVTMHSTAVVCCRLSPEEKALIVTMTRNRDKYITTLAIGDGANDCSMIKSANIGIGIAGNEGLHASNASDFSIPEFKYLRRLLFVHGHYTHLRNSELIEYCIYKNLLLVFINTMYSAQCLLTAQILLNDIMITMYNIIITFLPIFFYALTEHDIKERVLEVHPRVYSVFEKKPETNIKSIGLRMILALYHSMCIYYITMVAVYTGVTEDSGHNIDLTLFGYYLINEIVLIVTIKICLQTKHWTWATFVGLAFTVFVFIVLLLITNYTTLITETLINTMSFATRTLHFWTTVSIVLIVAFLPDTMYVFIRKFYHPSSYDLLHYQYRHLKKNCMGRPLDTGRDLERIEKMNKCLEEVQLRIKSVTV